MERSISTGVSVFPVHTRKYTNVVQRGVGMYIHCHMHPGEKHNYHRYKIYPYQGSMCDMCNQLVQSSAEAY